VICRGTYFLLLLVLGSLTCYGQNLLNQYIPIPPQELSVEQFLYHIEEVTGYHPAYSSSIIENKKLAIYSDSLTLKELLDTLFTVYDLQYIIRNDQLILSPQSKALQEKNMIRISGVVKHYRNNKPIPFANVFVPCKSMGTITNFDGRFELVLEADEEIDSIMVSCMGYSEQTVMPLDFLRGPCEVKLIPYHYQIEELIVRPLEPLHLLRGMIDNKSKNYADHPELLTAFFREVTKQNEKYTSLTEAVIDIYKTSYLITDEDLVQLKKGRRGSNAQASELVNLVIEGGLYNTIQLDVMKYGVSFLDPEFFEHYNYSFERQIMYNGRQTYILSFEYNNDLQITGFDGKMYIDALTLGLVRAEFSISEESLTYAYDILIKKVPKHYRIHPRYAKYEVEYRFYNDTWNLNHARSEVELKLRKKRDREMTGFNCSFLATSEFVITGNKKGEFNRIKYRDASKPDDILYEQVTGSDPEFWGNETTILPEEPLNETIKKLNLEETIREQSYVNSGGK
jgi:hypothetical protein